MLSISLYFTAGRFSATPWGRQVNEGMIEWPPSPWRLLRALVAVWRRTLPDVPEAEIMALLKALTAAPQYRLPRACEGHSRHYMPIIESGQETRSLIFDAFVLVPRDATTVIEWPDLALDDSQRALLAALLCRLPYLGRAESWCRADLTKTDESRPEFLCQPLDRFDGTMGVGDFERVPTLAADSTLSPRTLFAGLGADTATLRQERRDPYRPPGSRWITYARPREALSLAPRGHWRPSAVLSEPTDATPAQAPTRLARYALAGTVRPQALRTVDVAEAARRAVMSRDGWRTSDGQRNRPSPRFSGKDGDGRPLRGHRHVFYLPVDDDGDGFIDHLNICLRPATETDNEAGDPAGLTSQEARTLEGLQDLRGVTDEPLRLVLLHLGAYEGELPLGASLACGQVWESTTPYMLPRHPKPASDGMGWRADSPEQQLRRELSERFGGGIAEKAQILWLDMYRRNGQTWSWQAYRRSRANRDHRPPYRVGLGARITFPITVHGPIALGYGCHFGLGQFRISMEA